MPSESIQGVLEKDRPPRVHIKYEVYTGGALEVVELPFVVGVMADLSEQRKEPLPELAKRKFVEIDSTTFDDVLKKQAPRVAFDVKNTLDGGQTDLPVELNFQSMKDFEPANVAKQIGPLKELLEAREALKQALILGEGKDKYFKLLDEVLTNTEKRAAAAKALGIEVPASDSAAPQPEGPK